MGIQELEIKGFRSLRNVKWKPGKLNVLIGPNGSGKSNLLQVLGLLKASTGGRLPGEILDQGGIVPLLWDSREREIYWRFVAASQALPATYELTLRQNGSTSSYRIEREVLDGERLFLSRGPSGKTALIDNDGREKTLIVEEEFPALSYAFEGLAEPNIVAFRESVASWAIYSNFRVDREAPVRQSAITRFETEVSADGQNLVQVLHTLYSENRMFMKSVDDAMHAAFGIDYEGLFFSPAADQRIQLRIGWKHLQTKQSAANLSDGILRFLLMVAILVNPEQGDLIAIDEPETGLHPGMFPILAELAADAAERTQVIFTTHSPQFLDAFRDEAPTTTVTEWIDGETRFSVLDGDELKRWLKNYSLGELFTSGELEVLA
jgi:predicted ATPase